MKKQKKWTDPVVEETRERGRSLTRKFGNNPKKIFNHLKKAHDENIKLSQFKKKKRAS